MNVYVLQGSIPYEGSTVLGVYASYREAVEAAQVYDREDQATGYPTRYVYLVNEIVLGAPAQDRLLDGEEVQVEGV